MTPLRKLLSLPQAWTQDAYARTSEGVPVSEESPQACSFCLVGAVYRCYHDLPERDEVFRKLNHARERVIRDDFNRADLMRFNDHKGTTHADVLALIDKAGV